METSRAVCLLTVPVTHTETQLKKQKLKFGSDRQVSQNPDRKIKCRVAMTFETFPSTSHFLVSEVNYLYPHLQLFPWIHAISFIFLFLFFFSFWIQEWLIDRKRIPSDWRKKLAAIRARISKDFSSLPKDIDPYFQTLDPEGVFPFLV